ncbi:Down syndrome cell adhesion molecule-like protein Dscam2, partial [Orchesella cincta]
MSNVDFIWFKNGKLLQRNSRINLLPPQHKLQIFNAKLEDQGVYQCFAEVKVEEHFVEVVLIFYFILLASAPEIVQTFISQSLQPGPSVSLKCSATGNPTPSFAWFVDDVLLSPGVDQGYQQLHTRISIGFYQLQSSEKVSHLNISQVRRGDSGAYRCEASNLVGKSFHSARLNIYGPIFVKEMKAITLAAGENAWIPCHYGGFPVDKVVWQKDSR